MGDQKNLEARNELYKGAFRTPFAFLLGGPAGVILNAVYTGLKTGSEVKEHNEFLEKMESERKEYEAKKAETIAKIEAEEKIYADVYDDFCKGTNIKRDYIRRFDTTGDYNWYKMEAYLEMILTDNGSGITEGKHLGYMYRMKEFCKKYFEDKENDNIKAMLWFMAKRSCMSPTIGYVTKADELVCVNHKN